MRFLVDECLSPILARLLAEGGHDAAHVRDLGRAGAEDDEILQLAASEDRVLISADADFSAILTLGKTRKPSLILFRGFPGPRAAAQAKLILGSLPVIESYLHKGGIVVIKRGKLRIREL